MKKALSIALIAGFLTFGLVPQGAMAVSVCDAAGTAQDPWLVYSESDLESVGHCGASIVNGQWVYPVEQNYKLMADVALSSLGWASLDFYGTANHIAVFDGNNHKISNLRNLSKTCEGLQNAPNCVGLFGSTRYAKLVNIKIELGQYINAISYAGALVGMARSTQIENVHVIMPASSYILGSDAVGGLAGEVRENSSVKNCSVIGIGNPPITAQRGVGGLVGNLDESTIENVAVINVEVQSLVATYSANSYFGGIIGRYIPNTNQVVRGLFFDGRVNYLGSYDNDLSGIVYVGGLIGYLENATNNSLTIKDSAVAGLIQAGYSAGVQRTVQPGAFSGGWGSHVLNFTIENSYSRVLFKDVFGIPSAGDFFPQFRPGISVVNSLHETGVGFVAGSYIQGASTGYTAINSIGLAPSSWSISQSTSNYKVADSTAWAINSNFNDGRPMPAALYNLGIFGAVTTPPPAQAPAQSNSNPSSGVSGELPASTKPKETKSSIVRKGNKLQVLASSPEIMRLMVNGRTVIRVDADGEINQTITLKRGISLVNFVTGKTIARKFKFNVK